MRVRGWSTALLGLSLVASSETRAQQAPDTAKVESIPLELKSSDRYQIPSVLEPIRRVTITAPFDGIVRSLELPVGSSVRDRQEVAQLDRAEALARLKIAEANVKEMKAAIKGAANTAVAEAQLEAAQARAELANLDLERCTLRAPFAGRLLDVSVSPGQFLPKGAKVADLADDSSLRALVPLDRSVASVGSNVKINVEGQVVEGKVQASLPLPESLAPLRELATAFTAAWVVIPNAKGQLEPGQRALSPSLPTSTIANIPARALQQPGKGASGGARVQVIRNEYVTSIPVRVMGNPGPERVQVSGLFRPSDALIVSSSVPLVAGTLIRFSGNGGANAGVEATNPDPSEGGELAGITPPRSSGSRGSSGSTTKGRTPSSTTTRVPPATPPAAPKGAAPPPF